MMKQLVLADEQLDRRAEAIRLISQGALIAQGIAQVVIIVLWLLNREFPVVPFTFMAVSAMLISSLSGWLGRRGKVKVAGYFLTIGFTLYTAIITPFFWGFAGPLPIIYLFTILIAGMVIKLNASFFVATLAALLYLAMIPVEQAGILPQIVEIGEKETMLLSVTVNLWIIFFYLIAFLSWFSASRLSRALGNIRRYATELQVANEKLQAGEEELRASNEELRATEEELRTSNEELEAANEELRESQEHLVRSERLAAIGQLAGGVGHELRNPLGAIKNAVYYIKGKVAKSELAQKEPRVAQFLDIADEEISSANKIINDLLGFSRVGKPTVSPARIKKVVEAALSRVPIPENVELIERLDTDPAEIEIDSEQVQQVLVNVITNAVQAMPDGGKLTIGTGEKKGFIEVEITDTGEGIPREIRDKIFEPLFTTRAKGIGLGLAVSKSIIDRHGGRIEVKNGGGGGTTFAIKLPLKVA